MTYTLDEINQMSQETFVQAFGHVFEETPAIAATTWQSRPFSSLNDLCQHLCQTLHSLSEADKLALIRAHPDLGSRLKMAPASVQEQASLGLDQLTPEEYEAFQSLNHSYRDKFGFPFIIAVKNHTRESVLSAFQQRLQNSIEQETQQALTEIEQIARFRLADIVSEAS